MHECVCVLSGFNFVDLGLCCCCTHGAPRMLIHEWRFAQILFGMGCFVLALGCRPWQHLLSFAHTRSFVCVCASCFFHVCLFVCVLSVCPCVMPGSRADCMDVTYRDRHRPRGIQRARGRWGGVTTLMEWEMSTLTVGYLVI